MNDEKKVTVKKIDQKSVEFADGNKYDVKSAEDKKELTFKGEEEQDIPIKFIKSDSKEKDKDDKWTPGTLKVKYDGSWYTHGVKISSKDLASGVSLKEEKNLKAPGVKGFKITFWIVIVVAVVLVAGLIWWWIASSKKEDKEEESL